MRNGDILSFGAATVSIEQADLAKGGQGTVHAAETLDRPPIRAIVKTMAPDPDQLARVEALIDRGLGERHPYLCAPLACALEAGELRTLALMAEGKPLDQDDPRPLPDLIESAHHAACLWTVLEEDGVDHGDIAPSNLLFSARGSVSLIDFENWNANDGSAPPPTMIGQPMMLAPELVEGSATPNRLSDRFAWGVLFNLLLLGRHPADGLAENPAERREVMACGTWPERHRAQDVDELPIDALGPALCSLFDRAFSLLPAARPSADDWRRGLHAALEATVIHRCGAAFVHHAGRSHCPDCYAAIPAFQPKRQTTASAIETLRLRNAHTGASVEITLADGATVILGRRDIPGASGKVSGKHLELRRRGRRVHLRHIGRNPTAHLDRNERLTSRWLALDAATAPLIRLQLADTEIEIGR